MSNKRSEPTRTSANAGKLSRDIDRLARKAGVSREEVYAFLCNGYTGSGDGTEWLDKDVSDDVRKYLPVLKT